MPLIPVNRLLEFCKVVFLIPYRSKAHILHKRQLRINVYSRIILPFVGITYLHHESGKLFLSLSLGGIAHPGKIVDMLPEGDTQVLHKPLHVLFAFLWEILGHVKLPYSLSEHRIGDAHSAFPTRLLLLLAAHHTVIEFKGGIIEIIAQKTRNTAYGIDRHKILDFAVGKRREYFIQSLHELRRGHNHTIHIRRAEVGEICFPVNVREFCLKLRNRIFIVAGLPIASLLTCHLRLSKLPFSPDKRLPDAFRFGIALSGEGHYALDVGFISLHYFCIGLTFLKIVIPVAETKTGFAYMHRIDIRVLGIRAYPASEKRVAESQEFIRQKSGKIFCVRFLNMLKSGLKRRGPFTVEARAVHRHSVKVAHFLRICPFHF